MDHPWPRSAAELRPVHHNLFRSLLWRLRALADLHAIRMVNSHRMSR